MNATEAQVKASAEANRNLISTLTIGQLYLMMFAPHQYWPLVVPFSGAILFTIVFRFNTASFRGRTGSLTFAYGLVAFMWLVAAFSVAGWLLGGRY